MGKGVGDLNIKAICGLLIQRYAIIDAVDYDPMTSDSGKFTLSGGTANISYSSNGLSFTGISKSDVFYLYNRTLPTDYVFEMDIVAMGRTSTSASLSAGAYVNNASILQRITDSKWIIATTQGITEHNSPIAPYHLRVVVEDTKITVYGDDVELYTGTLTRTGCGIIGYQYRRCTVKNFMIKPL